MTLNRASGLFVCLAGLFLLFRIIPNHTEMVDYGWLKPATLPGIAAVIISLAGGLHALFPKGTAELDPASAGKACLFLGICVLGLGLLHLAGFVIAAPALMLALMLMVGERRWQWLLSGVVLLPAFIWLFIDVLLGRPLP